MSNFISNYFNKLRASDEKIKHRSAMTMAIIISVIVLTLIIFFFKDRLFNINDKPENQSVVKDNSISSDIESPLSSFFNFFKDTGEQFSNLKSDISSIYSSSSEKVKK